ncbi:MAG TPA: AarF/ABC1/UbiB kinase family protein [Chloroflexota bacterium]|nr:AarF/ABC1/UbiB kinase family protein [Chloroflexota bacterium]
MAISLKPEHLKRYRDLAWFLIKYGRSDLVRQAGLDRATAGVGGREPGAQVVEASAREADGRSQVGTVDGQARALADDVEKLGPTYIKLGQLLSTRPDLLPLPYVEALSRLQDDVAPFSYEDVERIVYTELGVPVSRAFAAFESVPVAAASLGQVHRARLRDGREVAVKVQRPAIRQRVVDDFDALAGIAEFLDEHTELGQHYQFGRLLEEFRATLLRELDYRLEANNLAHLRENLKDFDRLVVPAPVEAYTTSRVLTMDYIAGQKITALSDTYLLQLNGAELAEQLFHAYLRQVVVDGFFHADPHPGNILLTEDGKLGLIDVGMVARLTPRVQEQLIQLLLAMSDGRGDSAADAAVRLGEPRPDFDEATFRRRVAEVVARQHGASAGELEVGRMMLEVTRISGECHIRVPPELAMLGKTLLNLDQVGQTLDPAFDPAAAVKRHAAGVLRDRMLKSLSPGSVISSLVETRELVETLPRRLNRILEHLAENDLAVKVDAIDERYLMEGLQKIANRITLGLVLAALIVGAAMLTTVPTTFRVLGYPAIAMLFFLLAAGGGVLLAINILFRDERAERRP